MKSEDRQSIVNFLLEKDKEKGSGFDVHKTDTEETEDGKLFPYNPLYLSSGNVQFLDLDGYPAMKSS